MFLPSIALRTGLLTRAMKHTFSILHSWFPIPELAKLVTIKRANYYVSLIV